MTTNQTIDGVPREWLEEYEALADLSSGTAQHLRALLDATTCEFHQSADECESYSGKHPCSPAAQPQGEPVAWVECSPAWLKAGGDCATAPRLCVGRDGISHLHPANAEQPAPIAVTLQQVLSAYEYAESHPHKYLRGTTNWCAAVAWSLSGKRPAYANPPPGTEPSGTHPHNDGLDEWRKPQDDQGRRAELLESLAKQVYQSWESQPGFVPWVDGGNSLKQDEARQIASRTFELALANQVGD